MQKRNSGAVRTFRSPCKMKRGENSDANSNQLGDIEPIKTSSLLLIMQGKHLQFFQLPGLVL